MQSIFITLFLLPFFILASCFVFLIPGHVLLSFIKDREKENDDYIYSFSVGIAFALLLLYATFWLRIPLLTPLILIGVNIYAFLKVKSFSHWRLEQDKVNYFIIFVGSIFFLGLVWFSGWNIGGYERYFGVNAEDGLIHYSRIKNMLHTFPPTHPGLAGIPFNGYHYFYDLILAGFIKYFNFPIADLYFRFFPLIIAPFYGLSFLYLAKRLTMDKRKIRFILLFAYFSSGFSSLLTLLNTGFSANFAQPLALMVNPSFLLSISLLLIIFTRLPRFTQRKYEWILIGLLIGVLSQLKVYAGLLAIIVLVLFSLYHFIKYKREVLLPLLGANSFAALLTMVTFLPNNIGAGGLSFVPFVIYSHFMQQPFLNFLQWENKRLIYQEHNNYLRLAILSTQAFILYWTATLGVRLLLVFSVSRLCRISFWRNEYSPILVIAITFPIILASLFIQTISVFDTGQFFWVSVMFISIPCGLIMGEYWEKKRGLSLVIMALFIVSIAALGYQEYNHNYRTNGAYTFNNKDNEMFNEINKTVRESEHILVLHEKRIYDSGEAYLHTYPPVLVSGKTGRDTYYESEKNVFLLNQIYDKRKELLFRFHRSLSPCDQSAVAQIIKSTNTPYLVTLFESPCLATHSALLEVASSEKAVFYKLQEK